MEKKMISVYKALMKYGASDLLFNQNLQLSLFLTDVKQSRA